METLWTPTLPAYAWEEGLKKSVRLADVWDKTWNKDLPNAKQECCLFHHPVFPLLPPEHFLKSILIGNKTPGMIPPAVIFSDSMYFLTDMICHEVLHTWVYFSKVKSIFIKLLSEGTWIHAAHMGSLHATQSCSAPHQVTLDHTSIKQHPTKFLLVHHNLK